MLNGKFNQFEKLLKHYEEGDVKVTMNDLEGFWDLIHLQVLNHLDF